jgi:hypothetical protein
MSTLPNLGCWFSVALLMAGCGESPVSQGGSGTDAGNALTVLARTREGDAAKGATVAIWPADQIPDLAGTAPSFKGTTDSSGQAIFTLPTGTWSILVRLGGTSCWKLSPPSGRVIDTLEPNGTISGILQGGGISTISVVGLGTTAVCDSSGYFQLDSLPAGTLSLVVTGGSKTSATSLTVASGEHAIFAVPQSSIPTRLDTLLSDTLAMPSTLPLALSPAVLGDTGAFAVDIQLHRADSTSTARIFSWTNGATAEIRLSWIRTDSLQLELNGVPTVIAGIPLGTGTHQVGLLWTGTHIEVYLDKSILLSSASATLANRATWNPPVVGESGIAKVDWTVSHKGLPPSDWFTHQP